MLWPGIQLNWHEVGLSIRNLRAARSLRNIPLIEEELPHLTDANYNPLGAQVVGGRKISLSRAEIPSALLQAAAAKEPTKEEAPPKAPVLCMKLVAVLMVYWDRQRQLDLICLGCKIP